MTDFSISKEKKEIKNISYQDQTPTFFETQKQKIPALQAIVSIPNTNLLEPVVQADDNSFYLEHNLSLEKDGIGATFLDYRIDMDHNPKKILIFGHNSKNITLPFQILEEYENFSYFETHPIIQLETKNGTSSYEIFSAFVETENWDYMNLKFDSEEKWYEHLKSLKERSLYETNVTISKEDDILILQTCSENPKYDVYRKYLLVIGRRMK